MARAQIQRASYKPHTPKIQSTGYKSVYIKYILRVPWRNGLWTVELRVIKFLSIVGIQMVIGDLCESDPSLSTF